MATTADESWEPRPPLLLGLLACVAALILHTPPLLRPGLFYDDFQMVRASWTWQDARDNLWQPHNEHAMPLGRLTTWALVVFAGRPTNLPLVTALQGPLALLASMGLAYLFVRRELGHPFYGLLAMTLFGMSTHYVEAVAWFAASFALLALDMTLLALLAAQRWRQTGQVRYLVLCAACAALAPGWSGAGVLAGFLGTLYLLGPRTAGDSSPAPRCTSFRRRTLSLVPLAGTAGFLAISLPRTAEHILSREHLRQPFRAQDLLIGLDYTCRSLVDNLVTGALGVPLWDHCRLGLCMGPVPRPWVYFGGLFLVVAGSWWWWRAPQRRLALVGVGFILPSYLLIYASRAPRNYTELACWSRYQLFAHLGLVLFILAGLPRWHERLVQSTEPAVVRRRRFWLTFGLGILFLAQLPWCMFLEAPGQMADLRRIEEMDARCREYHIDAATARAVLPYWVVSCSSDLVNGWEFLRGSDEPRPMNREEVERLLLSCDAAGTKDQVRSTE
jgi:hypothetical protein